GPSDRALPARALPRRLRGDRDGALRAGVPHRGRVADAQARHRPPGGHAGHAHRAHRDGRGTHARPARPRAPDHRPARQRPGRQWRRGGPGRQQPGHHRARPGGRPGPLPRPDRAAVLPSRHRRPDSGHP
ncbi:MAG: Protein translocase subunit SecD, partial [uncultured Actinomycetospora sp.]